MAPVASEPRRRPPVGQLEARVGAVLEQKADELEVAVRRGGVQGREAALTTCVRIRSGLEQEPRALQISTEGRCAEGRHASDRLVPGRRVEARSAIDEKLHDPGTSREAGEMKRREAVRRELVDLVGSLVEELPQTFFAPERRRLAGREGRVRWQQSLREPALVQVERMRGGEQPVVPAQLPELGPREREPARFLEVPAQKRSEQLGLGHSGRDDSPPALDFKKASGSRC